MEGIPKESETIAIKRSKRLRQRLYDARIAFFSRKEWWTDGPIEFL